MQKCRFYMDAKLNVKIQRIVINQCKKIALSYVWETDRLFPAINSTCSSAFLVWAKLLLSLWHFSNFMSTHREISSHYIIFFLFKTSIKFNHMILFKDFLRYLWKFCVTHTFNAHVLWKCKQKEVLSLFSRLLKKKPRQIFKDCFLMQFSMKSTQWLLVCFSLILILSKVLTLLLANANGSLWKTDSTIGLNFKLGKPFILLVVIDSIRVFYIESSWISYYSLKYA